MESRIDKKLKVAMKPLTADEKNFLWKKIQSRMEANPPKNSIFDYFLMFPRISVASVMVFVLLGGAMTSLAAGISKPGDFLYPFDLALEKLMLAISFDDSKKTKLNVKFSEERLEEIDEILKNDGIEKSVKSFDASNTTFTEITHEALISTLSYLKETKEKALKTGSQTETKEIDTMISDLTGKTKNYLDDLNDVKEKIRGKKGNGVIKKIEKAEKELKIKFEINKDTSEKLEENEKIFDEKRQNRQEEIKRKKEEIRENKNNKEKNGSKERVEDQKKPETRKEEKTDDLKEKESKNKKDVKDKKDQRNTRQLK